MDKWILAVTAALIWASSGLMAQSQQEVLRRADQLKETDYAQALKLYEQVLAAEPDHYDALFEASFLNTKVGKRIAQAKERDQHYHTGMERAERCLALRPDDARSHFIVAVALGRMTEIQAAKTRVENSRRIRQHCEKALALRPDMAAAWHVLGKLHFRLSNMTIVEKAAAQALFGGLPPGSTNEAAISAYRKAVELRPEYLLYRLDLAAALMAVGRKDESRLLFQAIAAAPAITEDDAQYKAEAALQAGRM